MKINYSFGSHFLKQVPIYVAGALICSSFLTLIVSFKTKLNKEQIFDVFISASSLSVDTNKLKTAIEEKINDDIVSLNIHVFNPAQADFAHFFNTIGVNSDLLILSEDALVMVDPTQYLELPDIYKNAYNYVGNEKQIGYRVYDGEEGYLTDYIKYEEKNYYAFVYGASVHTLDFADKGTTHVISDIFKGLLTNEKED